MLLLIGNKADGNNSDEDLNMDDLYDTDPMHDFYNTEHKEEIHE